MRLVRLTRDDGDPVFVNLRQVAYVMEHRGGSSIVFAGGHAIAVKESVADVQAETHDRAL